MIEEAVAQPFATAQAAPRIGLEQYYSEAGPDYAAWSREFNMHFGYYRAGANPLDRESMLEQMNAEALARLNLDFIAEPCLLDLGCGLGATLRSLARRLPRARLLGITRVPWQVERARVLNDAAGCDERVRVIDGDYEHTLCHVAVAMGHTRSRAVVMRMVRTRAPCWRRRTACCGLVDDSSLRMAFSGATGLLTHCSTAFTAGYASAG